MTTTAQKNKKPSPPGESVKSSRKPHIAKAPKKPLRIRPELLPDTATYGTFAGKEYIMIPVEDFGEWYEDATLGAIAQDRLENDDGPALPLEASVDEIEGGRKRKAGR